MNPSDEIKSRLDIVETIRDYIPLKAAGMNFRANCPFHNEKTPSFMVSPEKQIWHCFGCGKGGDIISFVMEMEGISFIEALRILAPKAGVKLERQDPRITSQRNRLLDILELSSKYYHKVLTDSKLAEPARAYLEKRGLSDETIEDWRIGYSPDSWDDLANFLKSKGFKDDEIFAAGMSAKKEGMNRYYNRFRGRIMFPIRDINCNVVAFSARVSPEKEATEKMGKYINSPQTMIYDKSRLLFGLDKAKMAIKQADLAIVVEGQMDVITAHQHGFKNIIASSGTALTAEQIKLIRRYTNNIALALDSDAAGQMATDRGESVAQNIDYYEVEAQDNTGRIRKFIDPILSYNINIKIIEIPNGKDPDECIRKNSAEWERASANAKPVMQYHFEKIFRDLDLDNIDNRREATKKFLTKIIRLSDKIEQDYWIKKLSQKIDIDEAYLREALSRTVQSAATRNVNYISITKQQPVKTNQGREELVSDMFLALLIKFPVYIKHAADYTESDWLFGDGQKRIYKDLIMYYNTIINSGAVECDISSRMNYQNFRNWLKNEAQGDNLASQLEILDRLVLLADKDFSEYDEGNAQVELIGIINYLKKNHLSSRLKELSRLIAQVEEEKRGKEVLDSLMEEYKNIAREVGGLE